MERRENVRIHPAFTLLELLIVIGIIALLLAIALPAGTRLINNQKRNNTYANMQIIENAISSFEQSKPLKGKYKNPILYSPMYGDLPPDYALWQKDPTVPPEYETIRFHGDLNNDGLWSRESLSSMTSRLKVMKGTAG